MWKEIRYDIFWCYRKDPKKMGGVLISFALTCLCMLALVVILTVQAGR